MKPYAFGVDVGGTTTKFGLFETNGALVDMWETPTRKELNETGVLEDIYHTIESKLLERGLSKLDVEGVGIGVPAPVDSEGTVYKCANLNWGVFNVRECMETLSGLKTKVGNDANVAALGEMWQGGGSEYQSIVLVTLGTGVGGGVILDGKIVSGTNGSAGEIGHIPIVDGEEELCGCGGTGHLEQYASANGCARVAKRYLAAHPDRSTSLTAHETLTSKEVFDDAKAGDEVALDIVDEVGRYLGKGLAIIACVINPEAFVIGGGMAKAGNILIETIEKHFREYAFFALKETEFKLAKLGNSAGIYGAARMVLE